MNSDAQRLPGPVVTLRLNSQQLALLDRTVASGVAPDRVSLVRLALREYAAAHPPGPQPTP
jgi:Arc/MetJ-type ribon-helix-helix transcriptional regulator